MSKASRRFSLLRKSQKQRMVFVALCLLGALYLVISRAYELQITSKGTYQDRAKRQHKKEIVVKGPRGKITDRNGRELAVSGNAPSIVARPRKISRPEATAIHLAAALELSPDQLSRKLSGDKWFVWIRRHVSPETAQKVAALKLEGIEIVSEPKRYYPGKSLGGQLLGFVDVDGVGLSGIEKQVNEFLEGAEQELTVTRDSAGRILQDPSIDEGAGANVTLTIDATIQSIAEEALAKAAVEHSPESAQAIVMDVATGEILALAQWPPFDPNGDRSQPALYRNRVVTDAFEIGSIFKIFSMVSALENEVVTTRELIDVHWGKWKLGRKLIRDTHDDKKYLTAGEVIKYSSNVGSAKIALRVGARALHETYKSFGFGDVTGVELPGEVRGVIRNWKKWYPLDLATASYGYGLTATGIQIAAAVGAVANGGLYHEPRLLKRVATKSGEDIYQHHPAPRRVTTETVAGKIKTMMQSVFDRGPDGGTARLIEVPGFTAGGKTGTAHKLDRTTGKYSEKKYMSSFAGIAPINNPRVAVVVVFDSPSGKHYYGSKVAGPVFGEVASSTLRYMGVETELKAETLATESVDEFKEQHQLLTAMGSPKGDFQGLRLAEALRKAHGQGLEVRVEGTGRVVQEEREGNILFLRLSGQL